MSVHEGALVNHIIFTIITNCNQHTYIFLRYHYPYVLFMYFNNHFSNHGCTELEERLNTSDLEGQNIKVDQLQKDSKGTSLSR